MSRARLILLCIRHVRLQLIVMEAALIAGVIAMVLINSLGYSS
jgi:hypothetical protein